MWIENKIFSSTRYLTFLRTWWLGERHEAGEEREKASERVIVSGPKAGGFAVCDMGQAWAGWAFVWAVSIFLGWAGLEMIAWSHADLGTASCGIYMRMCIGIRDMGFGKRTGDLALVAQRRGTCRSVWDGMDSECGRRSIWFT